MFVESATGRPDRATRGQALASIGGVAQVTLQSRPRGQTCGAEITCHGGQLSAVRDWNRASGTRVEVPPLGRRSGRR